LTKIRKRDKDRCNGYEYPGPLIGKLSLSQVSENLVSAIQTEQFDNKELILICKKIAHLIYEGVGLYINVLRYQYGQHWLKPVEKYQEGDGLSDYFADYDIRWHNPANGLLHCLSPKLGTRSIQIIFLGDHKNPEKQAVEKNDLQNLVTACQQHYKPSIAAQLLLNAHELADKGEWRLALFETATALEAAVNHFLTGKIHTDLKASAQISKQKIGIDRKGLTVIAATLAGADKAIIDGGIKLITLRNKYIHEGVVDDEDQIPQCVSESIQLVAVLLADEVKKLCHYNFVMVKRGSYRSSQP
jgi:hypothetical protein